MFSVLDGRPRFWRAAAVAVMAGALTLSGCAKTTETGSGTGSGATVTSVAVKPEKVEEIAATLPEEIRS